MGTSDIAVNVGYLEVISFYVGHVHVVGRGANIFILLISEHVDTNQVNLHKKGHKNLLVQ